MTYSLYLRIYFIIQFLFLQHFLLERNVYAERASASSDFAKSVKTLLRQLGDTDIKKSKRAYQRLSKVGAKTIPFVLDNYKNANLLARGLILRLILEQRPTESIPLLLHAMVTEEEGILRAAAAKALVRVKPNDQKIHKILIRRANTDYDKYTRLVIVNSLVNSLSEAWKAIIPSLIKLLKEDTPKEIRQIACRGLLAFTYQDLNCEFKTWDKWWINNQDIFNPKK